jgi:PKD repeat protein/uncharacterized protein YraI
MSFWNQSSTLTKVIILGAVAVVLFGLTVLAVFVVGSLLSNGAVTSMPPGDISGTVAPPGGSSGGIIVIVPTPRPGTPYVTANTNVNIRSGPGTEYPTIGYMAVNLSGEVAGINPERTWWAIKFPPGPDGLGWVSAQYVTAYNADNVAVIQPPPVPQPTATPPVSFSGWRGEYFNNRDVQGNPVAVRDDARIDFDWTGQSPAEGVPADNFSTRWTISRDVTVPGTYRFSMWVDDGVRMWVDDQLIIDDWREGGARNVLADVNLARGAHTARVEYFQATAAALIQLQVGYLDQYTDWKAEYFDNPNVQEPPVVVRNEVDINYNWGPNSPLPGVPANNFSARWSRRISVPEDGTYLVRADVAGGVRLWVDGVLLIDSWASEGPRGLEAQTGDIQRGDHDLRVDYFKATGDGQIRISANKLGSDGPPKAGINGATGAQAGQPVAFNARSSSVAPGSHITTFAWDFGDGTGASGVDVVHIYTQPGSYEVKLTVTDDKGRSDTATHGINITGQPAPPEGQPPMAVITALAEARPGQDILFDASQSQGPNPIISYAWDFGDGTTANALNVHKVYNTGGLYNVILTVTDSQGLQSSANHQINIVPEPVQPTIEAPTPEPEATDTPVPEPEATHTPEPDVQPPTAAISVSQDGVTQLPIAGPVPVPAGQPVYFLGTASSPGSSPITGYQWDFGGGQVGQGDVVTHTFSISGTYKVSLTVTDEEGQTGTAAQEVQVQ